MGDTVSGVIHCGKVLCQGGVRHRLRQCIAASIPAWLRRVALPPGAAVPVLPGEAAEFRAQLLALILPEDCQPRRKAHVQLMASILNSDWRQPGYLVHYCAGCCSSDAECSEKLIALLPRTLTCFISQFNRGNWTGWPGQLRGFLLAGIHGFLCAMLRQVLEGDVDIPDADQQQGQADHLGGGWPEEQGGAEGPLEAWEVERREHAKSLRIALDLLSTPGWFHDIFLLRCCLGPQVRLMAHIVHSVSDENNLRQMQSQAQTGRREYAVLDVLRQTAVKEMFQRCWERASAPFPDFNETELFRSSVLRLCFRSSGVVALLLKDKFEGMPWRIFSLIDDRTLENAQSILDLPECCHDEFSSAVVAIYPSATELIGEECIQMLLCVSSMMHMTTFGIERVHSQNARRRSKRVQTHNVDVADLASLHQAFACASYLRFHCYTLAEKPGTRRRGRPSKHAEGRKRRRVGTTGGGGAWRAYIHERHRHRQMSRESLRQASLEYRQLTPLQMEHYKSLGRAGALPKRESRALLIVAVFVALTFSEKHLVLSMSPNALSVKA